MEKLLIDETSSSPKIEFDPESAQLNIDGEVYPENSAEFFAPIISWVDSFLSSVKKDIVCNMRISYFNTSSSKYLMMFLDRLNNAHENGLGIVVNWYYEADDDMSKECGEEFMTDVELPFNLIEE